MSLEPPAASRSQDRRGSSQQGESERPCPVSPLLRRPFLVSRLSALVAHPRRTVGALAVVLAAVGITVGSGANFTAHAANPANTFTAGTGPRVAAGATSPPPAPTPANPSPAGTLTIGSSSSSALFNAPNMKPGDNVNGTVDIANTGSVPGTFTLSTSNAVDTGALLGQLDLKVEDCGLFSGATPPACAGTSIVYTGKAGSLTTAALGSFAANAKHRYKIDVTLPSTTGNTFQGKTASVEFDWDAA